MKISMADFKEENISDIRKYLIVRKNKRARDESSETKRSAGNEKKAKRWKRTDIECYFDVPETSTVIPKHTQMKRNRTIRTNESHNEKSKRNKIADGVTSWHTNNDERLKQVGAKRKTNLYCDPGRKKRTNIVLSDLRRIDTDTNVCVLINNPLPDPALAGSRVPKL